ncbi:hypothetical protein C8T65DRAFT_702785 [Cerioporus squamosus]|nr:hypothetical protein C8T65DRAFT_702785 [Cerioporus squamosus]
MYVTPVHLASFTDDNSPGSPLQIPCFIWCIQQALNYLRGFPPSHPSLYTGLDPPPGSTCFPVHNAWLLSFNRFLASFDLHVAGVHAILALALFSPFSQPPHVAFTCSFGAVARWVFDRPVPEALLNSAWVRHSARLLVLEVQCLGADPADRALWQQQLQQVRDGKMENKGAITVGVPLYTKSCQRPRMRGHKNMSYNLEMRPHLVSATPPACPPHLSNQATNRLRTTPFSLKQTARIRTSIAASRRPVTFLRSRLPACLSAPPITLNTAFRRLGRLMQRDTWLGNRAVTTYRILRLSAIYTSFFAALAQTRRARRHTHAGAGWETPSSDGAITWEENGTVDSQQETRQSQHGQPGKQRTTGNSEDCPDQLEAAAADRQRMPLRVYHCLCHLVLPPYCTSTSSLYLRTDHEAQRTRRHSELTRSRTKLAALTLTRAAASSMSAKLVHDNLNTSAGPTMTDSLTVSQSKSTQELFSHLRFTLKTTTIHAL